MKKIWILIYIGRGFIQEPELFYLLKDAKKRKNELLKKINPDYDEIGLFEKYIV